MSFFYPFEESGQVTSVGFIITVIKFFKLVVFTFHKFWTYFEYTYFEYMKGRVNLRHGTTGLGIQRFNHEYVKIWNAMLKIDTFYLILVGTPSSLILSFKIWDWSFYLLDKIC